MVGPFQSMVTRGISGKTPQTTSVQHCGSRVVTFQVALTLDLYELYMNIDSSSIFFYVSFLFQGICEPKIGASVTTRVRPEEEQK